MMKETNFGPLLLLLLLAVTPRNSCANPIASGPTVNGNTGGALADMASKTANDIKEGAEILTLAVTWLQENALSSHFDLSIEDLQNKITPLPDRLAPNRVAILSELFISKDRLLDLRSSLKKVATTLRSHCLNIISIYNKPDISGPALKVGADIFVNAAKGVKGILNEAYTKTKEINDLLSLTKALLIDFNAKLDYERKEIKAEQEAAGDIQILTDQLDNQKQELKRMLNEVHINEVTIQDILTCTFTLKTICMRTIIITNTIVQTKTDTALADRKALELKISSHEKLKNELDKQCKLLDDIRPAQTSATTLLSHVKSVKEYLLKEIDLINNWHIDVDTAILANEGISLVVITYNIDGITDILNVLIKACDDYIAHKIPDILQNNVSQITTGN